MSVMPRTRAPYRPEFRREAVELVLAGRSVRDVAESLGCSDQRPTARQVIAQIEADYAQLVGAERFEEAAQALGELLRGLASRQGSNEHQTPVPR
jgi:transposase-like protein